MLHGHDPAERRADGAAPADPLRGHGLGRSPADGRRAGPDAGARRATGWRPARSGSTRASTTSRRRTRRPRAGRAGQGRRRVRRCVRGPHPLQRDRQDRRVPRVRSRSAVGRACRSGQSHESVDDESEPCSTRPARRASTSGIDWYLYPAGSSHLLVWLPPEDQLGGFDATVQRLRDDPAHRRKVAAIIEEQIAVDPRHRRARVLLGHPDRAVHRDVDRGGRGGTRHEPRRHGGRPDRSRNRRMRSCVFRRGISREAFDAQARRTLNHPAFMVASDSVYHGALPHPRGYGCYAQVLGTFVRERGLVTLERAVHLMSGLPAERFGITRPRAHRRRPRGRPRRVRSGHRRRRSDLGRATQPRPPASTLSSSTATSWPATVDRLSARPGIVVRARNRD